METVPPVGPSVMPRVLSMVTPDDHAGEQGPGMSTVSPERAESSAFCTSDWEQEADTLVAALAVVVQRTRQATAKTDAGQHLDTISCSERRTGTPKPRDILDSWNDPVSMDKNLAPT